MKPTKLDELRAQLSAAMLDAEPNLDADDPAAEAARVNGARTLAEILQARLSRAEAEDRGQRIRELQTAIAQKDAQHAEALGAAEAADQAARNQALSLFDDDFRGRLESVLINCRSKAGNEHRNRAGLIEQARGEMKTSLAQVTELQGGLKL